MISTRLATLRYEVSQLLNRSINPLAPMAAALHNGTIMIIVYWIHFVCQNSSTTNPVNNQIT